MMASCERKPVLIPPRKRAAKKPGENTAPARVHCYDIITSVAGDDLKKGSPKDFSSSHSPCHKVAFASDQEVPTESPTDSSKNDHEFASNSEKVDSTPDANTTELYTFNKQSSSSQNSPSMTFENEEAEASEKSALNVTKNEENSYITMTGTIKRGKKAGQCVDICLNMSREELENLEAAIINQAPETKKKAWSMRSGLHVFMWTVLCMPFVAVVSGAYSFFMGTLTWYNVYLYYSEEKSIWHKICFCPLLILFYPFYIVIAVVGLALYAAGVQISWNYDIWFAKVQDLEKGFYGWLCSSVGLDSCAPYEVVILNETVQEDGVKFPVADTAL